LKFWINDDVAVGLTGVIIVKILMVRF